ncbi:hypothetical protein EMCRGX_G023538 [Ephydatia muelleri]|eukprot:Em0017g185a
MSDNEEQRYDNFDADTYLTQFFGEIESFHNLPAYVELFSRFQDASITMLDFGGGPSVVPLIASAPKVTRYIHADLARNNRTAVERWWRSEPGAFDWRENIRSYLKLEGKRGSDEEVATREARMRNVLASVVRCNVKEERVVPPGYEGPYDVVSCLNCLDCVCKSTEELGDCIKNKMSPLVKNGGYFMMECSTVLEHYTPEEQQDPDAQYLVRTSVRYDPSTVKVAGFEYDGFLYEKGENLVKLLESCGYTDIKRTEYIYENLEARYKDNITLLIGRKL